MSAPIRLLEVKSHRSNVSARGEHLVDDRCDFNEFIANFSDFIEADDAIGSMRRLVLVLALRGRLVRPDLALPKPKIERASVVSRSTRKARSSEKFPGSLLSEESPFSLPPNWSWARINDTGEYINGLPFKPSDWGNHGYPIIRIQNLTDAAKPTHRTQATCDDVYIVRRGDLLVSWSATLDVYIWDREPGVLNQHIFRVLPNEAVVSRRFLYYVLRYSIREMEEGEHAHGLVMKHINRGPFLAHPVPIPPLPEQKRIVAKLDQVMALCDELEVRQAKKRDVATRLTKSAFGALTAAAGAGEFGAAWERVVQNFDVLLSGSQRVGELKRTLRGLSYSGRLIGRRTPWPVATIENLATNIVDCPHTTPAWTETGILCLRTTNFRVRGLDLSAVRYVSKETYAERVSRLKPKPGDLVYSREGGILGIACVIPHGQLLCLGQRMMLIRIDVTRCDPHFVALMLNAPQTIATVTELTGGTASPHLNVGDVRKFTIPLPTLEEQSAVTKKIEHLMRLCDDLEAKLLRTEGLASKLIEAVVQEFVA